MAGASTSTSTVHTATDGTVHETELAKREYEWKQMHPWG